MWTEDIAYIAGIFDGEGCVTANSQSYLKACIANNNKELLLWISSKTGLGSMHLGSNKKTWYLEFNGRYAKQFLELVMPYLRVKKPQAELGITLVEDRRVDVARQLRALNH